MIILDSFLTYQLFSFQNNDFIQNSRNQKVKDLRTLQIIHVGPSPNGNFDFKQFKNMKFACSMKMCNIVNPNKMQKKIFLTSLASIVPYYKYY